MAELRAEAQGVITSLERALAEEREQGKQRLHRRAPAPTQALTRTSTRALTLIQPQHPTPSPTPTPSPIATATLTIKPAPALPLTRLRLELTGSASEQLAAQQARAREERIEAMHARAARHCANNSAYVLSCCAVVPALLLATNGCCRIFWHYMC